MVSNNRPLPLAILSEISAYLNKQARGNVFDGNKKNKSSLCSRCLGCSHYYCLLEDKSHIMNILLHDRQKVSLFRNSKAR